MSISKALNQQELKSLCDVLAHTSMGLTKSDLTTLLGQCQIAVLSDGSSRNAMGYTMGLNKRDWLYNCLSGEINTSHSMERIYVFLEAALNPVRYTSESMRKKYAFILEETNKVLMFVGLEIGANGKLSKTVAASSLDEVDRRVNRLQKALYDRTIHSEVRKYCIADFLREDYMMQSLKRRRDWRNAFVK